MTSPSKLVGCFRLSQLVSRRLARSTTFANSRSGDNQEARQAGNACFAELSDAYAIDVEKLPGDGILGRPLFTKHAQLARMCELALGWFLKCPPIGLGKVRQFLCLVADRCDAAERASSESWARNASYCDTYFGDLLSPSELVSLTRRVTMARC